MVSKKDLERTVRERTEELDHFFKLSLDMLCIARLEGRFIRLNPAFERVLGYSAEELCARDFLWFVHEEDREATLRQMDGLRAGKTALQFENRYRTQSGEWRHLAWNAAPVLEKGLIYASARDVTQQKKQEEEIRRLNQKLEARVAESTAQVAAGEERFRLMVEQVQDYAMITLDLNGNITSWNIGAERMKGYTAEEVLGRHFSCLYTEADVRAGKPDRLLARAREKGSIVDEGWRLRKNGERFWAEIVLTALRDSSGLITGFAKFTHDLTTRRTAELQVLRSQRLEAIGTLAGGIAHDLNNVLAPILMGMELLREDYPKESETLETFYACGRRAADMVRQLLTFAKGVDGERISISPQHLLKEMDRIMSSTFPKNIQLKISIPPKLPMVSGDATQLHQVLLNLCVNARDAMPNGGVLNLNTRAMAVDETQAKSIPGGKPGEYVVLSVQDNGIGMSPEIIDRIFEPFFTTKGPEKGTGLGLSTVLGIVKGHGGFLQVYSMPGYGSTFSVYLPAEKNANTRETRPGIPVQFVGSGETVLIVDDEADVRNIALGVLQKFGLKVFTASDGADALVQITEHRLDLKAIVTDLHMPRMDGITLIRNIRRILPSIPIAVFSGRPDADLAAECRQLKVAAILEKPFAQDRLLQVLQELLRPSGG